MTIQQAVQLLEQSEVQLRDTRLALSNKDRATAKKLFTKTLNGLDSTCAIQIDTLED